MSEFKRFGKHAINLDSIARVTKENGQHGYTLHVYFVGQDGPFSLPGSTPEGQLLNAWYERINEYSSAPPLSDR